MLGEEIMKLCHLISIICNYTVLEGTSIYCSSLLFFFFLLWPHIEKTKLGKKRLLLPSCVQSITEGKPGRQSLEAGTWRQVPKLEPWRNSTEGMLPGSGSATFPLQPRPPCRGMAPPRGAGVLLHPCIIMKTLHRYAHRQSNGGNSSTVVPFPSFPSSTLTTEANCSRHRITFVDRRSILDSDSQFTTVQKWG